MTPHSTATTATFRPDGRAVTRAVARRSFAVLATTSPAGRPHAAGVVYELVGSSLYVSTLRTSRKARNIAADPHVAMCVPIRRIPVGPPSSVQFQATADLLSVDDPHVAHLLQAGHLTAITGHGELDLPDGCVVRIDPPRRLLTYGLGMPLRHLVRDPLNGAGTAELAPAT